VGKNSAIGIEFMQVEVIYIASHIEFVEKIEVSINTTVHDAIKQSGLLEQHTNISLEKNKVGIFGEIVSLDAVVKENDRIEVYRALKMDPMDARRLRSEI
jgi:putative ubiquitin-RnfH superfamily antitoxin RatB of RatAB toxin-antitoxin module